MLGFALAALLGTPGTTRVFLAAPAEDVAKVVYAVTRALPVPRWTPSIPLERMRRASIACPREVPARVAPATSTP